MASWSSYDKLRSNLVRKERQRRTDQMQTLRCSISVSFGCLLHRRRSPDQTASLLEPVVAVEDSAGVVLGGPAAREVVRPLVRARSSPCERNTILDRRQQIRAKRGKEIRYDSLLQVVKPSFESDEYIFLVDTLGFELVD